MKKFIILLFLVSFTSLPGNSQSIKSTYILSGGELIFSFASLGDETGLDNIIRFSPVFNAQSWRVYDYGGYGFFHGLALRNVGFIVEDNQSDTKYKFRTYNVGIPVGLHLELGTNSTLFAGYELEIPFNFKQKTFIDDDKEDKFNSWFSNRTPTLNHGVFVAFQFIYGTQIKFKYYLNNFFNEDYTTYIDGVEVKPYEGFDANVFYFALTFNIFKDLELIVSDIDL